MTKEASETIALLEGRKIEYDIVVEPRIDPTGVPMKDENGNELTVTRIVIKKIPPLEQEINKFFSRSTPCWFPECESIRRRYFLELDRMAANGGCTDCQKGSIIRKYDAEVRAAIMKLHANESGNSRAEQIPGAADTGSEGASPVRRMLRKAAGCIKKILCFGS